MGGWTFATIREMNTMTLWLNAHMLYAAFFRGVNESKPVRGGLVGQQCF